MDIGHRELEAFRRVVYQLNATLMHFRINGFLFFDIDSRKVYSSFCILSKLASVWHRAKQQQHRYHYHNSIKIPFYHGRLKWILISNWCDINYTLIHLYKWLHPISNPIQCIDCIHALLTHYAFAIRIVHPPNRCIRMNQVKDNSIALLIYAPIK